MFLHLALCEHWELLHFGRLLPQPYVLTHMLISNQLNTQRKILERSLEFSVSNSSFFSNNWFYELSLLWLIGLSVPYPQLTVCTELHLSSSSLCCGLKSLSRDNYFNCLMFSFLKTIATYILFAFLFIQEDKGNLCHSILTQRWSSPKHYFFSQKILVCIEWIILNAIMPILTETLLIFFNLLGYLYLMLINSYFPISSYAPSDSYPGTRYLIQNYITVK